MDTNYNQNPDEKEKEKEKEKEDKMDIQIACKLLDIDTFIYTELTYDYVKRKYHKMALKWHPDKNGNTTEATKRFQKINEAYTYLVTALGLDTDDKKDDKKDDKNLYTSLLLSCPCFYLVY